MKYQGSELELFADASNWKDYWGSFIPVVPEGRALEVGSGIGSNLGTWLSKFKDVTLLEPDLEFTNLYLLPLTKRYQNVTALSGTIQDLDPEKSFDWIFYIDVLEHIEDDQRELKIATNFLAPGGTMFILVPALSILFSKFDESVGHFRRYSKADFQRLLPPGFSIADIKYLDVTGAFASLLNKLISGDYLDKRKVRMWDRFLVPISRKLDILIRYRLGKSLILKINKT